MQPESINDTPVDIREELFDKVHKARCDLQIVGVNLVDKALNDADPGRNISKHPDYIAAQERICNAEAAIRAFMQGAGEIK